VQLRFTPETAAYLLHQWLDKVPLDIDEKTLAELKSVLAWRTNPGRASAFKNEIAKGPKLVAPSQSYMASKFASPPPFPHVNLAVINTILTSADLPTAKNTDSLAGLLQLAQQLEQLCGVSQVITSHPMI
jgi:hypothetical protein